MPLFFLYLSSPSSSPSLSSSSFALTDDMETLSNAMTGKAMKDCNDDAADDKENMDGNGFIVTPHSTMQYHITHIILYITAWESNALLPCSTFPDFPCPLLNEGICLLGVWLRYSDWGKQFSMYSVYNLDNVVALGAIYLGSQGRG